MKAESSSLASAYRRRALCVTLGITLFAAGLAVMPHGTAAQGQGASGQSDSKKTATDAKKADDGKKAADSSKKAAQASSTDKNKKKKSNEPTLRVVPMPRQGTTAPGRAAAPPGNVPPGAQPTVLPGAQPTVPPGTQPAGPPITVLPGGNPPNTGQSGTGLTGLKSGGTPFSFDFRGADIANVLKFYAQMSGLTITADQALTGPVTIINPKPVTLDEAFKILQSVLLVRGFSAIQRGSVLTIAPLSTVIQNTPLLNPDEGGPIDPRDQVMTQVLPLENVDAKTLATELQPLINKGASLIGSDGTNSLILTDTSSNVERFKRLVDALDKTNANSEMRVYTLKRAEASSIADIINNLYSKITTRGKGAPQQVPGQPPPQPGQPGAQGAGGRPAVVAVADARTNSVIVVASQENQEQIAKDIIGRLDDNDTETLGTEIIKIKYADAQTIANLINTVLSNEHGSAANTSSSSGGSPFQFRAFGGFGGFGGGFNNQNNQENVSSTDPFGKVVADPRTNSLLVTASAEKMQRIKDLIASLDVDVKTETTTFVIPLKNANASDIAYAIGQAFGTYQNNNQNNPFGFFFGGGGGGGNNTSNVNGHTTIQRRQTPTRSALPPGYIPTGTGSRVPPGPPNPPDVGTESDSGAPTANGGSAVPQGIPGVMTDHGFVPTNGEDKPTRQFFGFGGGRQSLGQTSSPTYGRGTNGNYVNYLKLQNNVFVDPSPNGDSLIVTTTPDNVQAIKDIIDKLDVVPRQVMIELIVAEVTLTADQKLGFNLNSSLFKLFNSSSTNGTGVANFPAAGFSTGATVDPTASGFQFLLSGTNYQALLQALTTDNKIKILATPRVFTSNNQPADIEITTNVPYISGQATTGLVATAVQNNVTFQKIGFILQATPRITPDGLVTIDVVQDASDLLQNVTLGTGSSAITAPEFDDRFTDTSVTVQDGETVVIGGLIEDRTQLNTSKIPVLGDLPLVGQFFRSREKSRNKVELMIFMTPHVISSTKEARAMTLNQGQSVIQQLPDLPKQQPNLHLLQPEGTKTPNQGKPKPQQPVPNQNQPDNNSGTTTPNNNGSGSPLLIPSARP